MASGIRDFGFSIGARVLNIFSSMGIQSCLAWGLGPSDRGSYQVCLIFATILSIVFMVSCDSAGTYFVASKRMTLSQGVTNTVIYGTIGSILSIVAGYIALHLPIGFVDKATSNQFALALVSIPISLFSLSLLLMLTAIREFAFYSVVSVCSAVLQLLLTLLTVGWLRWGVEGGLLAMNIANGVTIVAILVLLRRKHNLKWVRPSLASLREMLHYGIRYHAGKIALQVNFQLGTIVLALFANRDQIGFFAVAATLTGAIIMIPDNLTAVLIPRVASDAKGRPELIAKCARVSGVVCGLALLVLCVFTMPIVKILLSPQFVASVPLIRILAIGILVWCMCKVFVPYLVGTDHPGMVSISVVIGTLVNLGLIIVLLPKFELEGAAIAMTVGYIASSIVLVAGFMKLTKLKLATIFAFQKADWAVLTDRIGRFVRRS